MPPWVQFQRNGRSESILEELRQGTVINEPTSPVVSRSTCLGSSSFSCCYKPKACNSLLCFVHFKGWGWGLKGKHGNAAFKSLMCHIVPFKTRPCLCSREDWGMEDSLRKCGFGSSSLLDFSFVPLKIYFSNVCTTWKRLRTKGQLK